MPKAPRPQFTVSYRSKPKSSKRRSKMPWIASTVAIAVVAAGGTAAWVISQDDTDQPTIPTPTATTDIYVAPANGHLSVDDVLGRNVGASAEADLKQLLLEGN